VHVPALFLAQERHDQNKMAEIRHIAENGAIFLQSIDFQ